MVPCKRSSIILDGNAKLGGVSRRVGGRDERPPQSLSPTSAAVSSSSSVTNQPAGNNNKRWIPLTIHKATPFISTNEHNDYIFRKVRGILNKLTPEKFDKLSLELLNVGIDSQLVLKGIILLIFEKALDEPKYSPLYARLCQRLCDDAPNFEPPSSNITTFRKLLLNKCQDEFENRSRATEAFERDGPLTTEEMEQCTIAKAKMLGNIKFIGELGKREMLHEGILHKCIKQLVGKKKVEAKDISEDLECLCQILRTVGKRLDHDKAQMWMDQYFERIAVFQANEELPSRIRFMLQDVIELRRNEWQPRKLMLGEGAPRTIQQVREEVAKESGMFIPRQPMISPTYMMTDPFFGPVPRAAMNGGYPGPQRMGDIFGPPMAPGMMGSGLGTGPGVIHIDHFAKGYQSGKGMRNSSNYNQRDRGGGQGQGQKFKDRNSGFGRDENRPYYNDANGDDGDDVAPSRNRYQRDDSDDVGGSYHNNHTGNHGGNDRDRHQKSNAQGSRELPPRFRKQQMGSQKEASQEDSPRSLTPMYGPPSGGAPGTNQMPPPPPPHMLVQQTGMVPYPPRGPFPPQMMASHAPIRSPMIPMMSGGPRSALHQNADDVSLRPVRNFAPMMRPNVQINRIASQFGDPRPVQPMIPGPLAQRQITEVHVATLDKNKVKAAGKHEPKQSTTEVKALLDAKNTEEAIKLIQSQQKSSKKFIAELLSSLMLQALEKSDEDREIVGQLVVALKDNQMLTSEHFMEAFRSLLDKLSVFEQDIPLAKSYLARFAALAVSCSVISLADLAIPMTGGVHYPLFLLCLQQLAKIKDNAWLAKQFSSSKINLQTMLPELNRDRMMETLEDRGLSFLLPLLRVQMDLWKQLTSDPNPTSYYKWIRDNVDNHLHSDTGFITILVTTIIRYVTSESTMKEGVDTSQTPEKALVDKEKELLDKFKGVLQKFLLDKVDLHVTAIYAMQVFSHNANNPKGLLLRLFRNLYDLEILYEDAFVRWKEEVNDLQPGKGQALFQVNQWLTWLEQAEEDSDEED